MAHLRSAGANIEDLGFHQTVGQTLDQGETVLNDDALWAALPNKISIYTKQQLRDHLRAELNASR
jgi:hypothetical protein